jgi:membrane-bound lytic murein transglycosylase MltF
VPLSSHKLYRMANRDKQTFRRHLLAGFAQQLAWSLVFSAVAAPFEVSAEQPDEAAGSVPPGERVQGESNVAPLADVWPSVSEPWTGDLEGMLERGEIRVLTAFSLGSFYIDRGRPRGAIYEAIGLFEEFVKKKLGAPAKNLKVVIIPVRRDQLLPFLVKGYGDLVMAQQLITPRRLESVDFSVPFAEKGREYVVTGTKYLNVLRDRYFADEALDPFQRSLFTMAGYNAGPNRINRLRKEAPDRKLDPNLWFGNVELVVAAEVGREPVRYVGNIYKYYIAYKRVLAELEARREARDQTH